MASFLTLRRTLAANALDCLAHYYPDRMTGIQVVKSGDGQTEIQNLHLAAYTPAWVPEVSGLRAAPRAWTVQLELHCVCDYAQRSLSEAYTMLIQTVEDFCARSDLASSLTSAETEGVKVDVVTSGDGREEIREEQFVTVFVLSCLVRGK